MTSALTQPPTSVRKRAPDPAAREALAWTHGARFLTTASRLDQLPAGDLPEIAFVGRSNAGKSTAINVLAQRRRLAFASRTPGRTQHVNLFDLGPAEAPDARFADLPGYGYAAVDRSAKLRWQEVMAQYLRYRRALAGVVLLVDARLGFTDLDERLLALIAPRVSSGEVRLLVLLTKADKLNRREGLAALTAAQGVLAPLSAPPADVAVTLFSGLTRLGIDDVAVHLRSWVVPAADGTAAAPGSAPAG
jgi:GTP-binding protein